MSDVSVQQDMETISAEATSAPTSVVVSTNEAAVVVEDSDTVVTVVENDFSVSLSSAAAVLVEAPAVSVIAAGGQGPKGSQGVQGIQGVQGVQGIAGNTGAPAGTYVHEQNIASAVWTINHGLGYFPPVVVLDSTGMTVEGSETYPDDNTIILTFSAAFGGTAYVG